MSIHIVISRYKENISWIDELPIDIKKNCYNKYYNDTLPLPNIGRESHTYLHHIVTNYDSLADITIFTQGHPFDHIPKDKFLEKVNDILKINDEYYYKSLISGSLHYNNEPYRTAGTVDTCNLLFGNERKFVEFFHPRAIFSVSKQNIKQNSLDFYKKCLKMFEDENIVDPIIGYHFERLWDTIFYMPNKKYEGKIFEFGQTNGNFSGTLSLDENGSIGGYNNPNERFWQETADGIVLLNSDSIITNKFPHLNLDIKNVGNFFDGNTWIDGWHYLAQTKNLQYYVDLIRNEPIENLTNKEKLEELICKCGVQKTRHNPGLNFGGLQLHQLYSQFADYLISLSTEKITKYMEIGVLHLGTFVFTVEYLSRFNPITLSVAVDPNISPNWNYYKKINDKSVFLNILSTSPEFKSFIAKEKFDLIFIDGDHSAPAVFSDYKICLHNSKILAFHDICDNQQPGVCHMWNRIKALNPGKRINEFTEQYEKRPNQDETWFGIGVIWI